MGADGGSIPKRAELVKTKSRVVQDAKTYKSDSWKYCYLSREPLQSPIVTCRRGRLYNKEAVLKHLLLRTEQRTSGDEDPVPHIRSLKDLIPITLTRNSAYEERTSVKAGETVDEGASSFACPVTGREMNGNFTFIYLKGCGCVMAEQALEKVKSVNCLKCGATRVAGDIKPLNGKLKDGIGWAAEAGAEAEVASDKRSASSAQTVAPARDVDRKRTVPPDDLPYLPGEDGYHHLPSLGGTATFRRTRAINSLYNNSSSSTGTSTTSAGPTYQ